MWINATLADPVKRCSMEWQPIETAPFGRDLELAVIDAVDVYALVFPCRRARFGWVKSMTGVSVDVHPSHWREWAEPTVPPGMP